MIAFEPSRPDAQRQATVAHVIDGGRHLREQGGIAVRVAGDEHAHLHAARLRREGRQHRPAFETGAVLVAEDRHEVVVDPAAVEAERLGLLPDGEEVVPRNVLVRRLDAEAEMRGRGFLGGKAERKKRRGEEDEGGSHAARLAQRPREEQRALSREADGARKAGC